MPLTNDDFRGIVNLNISNKRNIPGTLSMLVVHTRDGGTLPESTQDMLITAVFNSDITTGGNEELSEYSGAICKVIADSIKNGQKLTDRFRLAELSKSLVKPGIPCKEQILWIFDAVLSKGGVIPGRVLQDLEHAAEGNVELKPKIDELLEKARAQAKQTPKVRSEAAQTGTTTESEPWRKPPRQKPEKKPDEETPKTKPYKVPSPGDVIALIDSISNSDMVLVNVGVACVKLERAVRGGRRIGEGKLDRLTSSLRNADMPDREKILDVFNAVVEMGGILPKSVLNGMAEIASNNPLILPHIVSLFEKAGGKQRDDASEALIKLEFSLTSKNYERKQDDLKIVRVARNNLARGILPLDGLEPPTQDKRKDRN
ncbi:MAG: hypothetical protein V1744_05335 [Candidatus Altiarchaeota archaeon]